MFHPTIQIILKTSQNDFIFNHNSKPSLRPYLEHVTTWGQATPARQRPSVACRPLIGSEVIPGCRYPVAKAAGPMLTTYKRIHDEKTYGDKRSNRKFLPCLSKRKQTTLNSRADDAPIIKYVNNGAVRHPAENRLAQGPGQVLPTGRRAEQEGAGVN